MPSPDGSGIPRTGVPAKPGKPVFDHYDVTEELRRQSHRSRRDPTYLARAAQRRMRRGRYQIPRARASPAGPAANVASWPVCCRPPLAGMMTLISLKRTDQSSLPN